MFCGMHCYKCARGTCVHCQARRAVLIGGLPGMLLSKISAARIHIPHLFAARALPAVSLSIGDTTGAASTVLAVALRIAYHGVLT